MLGHLFGAGSLGPLEVMLSYSGACQKAIAANLANVECAGYAALDVPEEDFRQALDRAFRGEEAAAEFRPRPAAPSGRLQDRGQNVDLELEMAKMVRNSALHAMVATLLGNQFALLREAISGHVAA